MGGAGVQIGNHRRMDPGLYRVFPPYAIIRLHFNLLHTVQGNHVKLPDGFVVLGRVACGYDDPALGNWVITEGLTLEELKHGRGQGLGDTVDLVDEENAFFQPRFLHFFIDGGHDFTHGVFGDGFFLTAKFHF